MNRTALHTLSGDALSPNIGEQGENTVTPIS